MRLSVRYFGRVQGVGFRAAAHAAAADWPVTGWVCNEWNGSVLMEIQGSTEAVEGTLAAIREHMGRNITRVERMAANELPKEVGFEIRRG